MSDLLHQRHRLQDAPAMPVVDDVVGTEEEAGSGSTEMDLMLRTAARWSVQFLLITAALYLLVRLLDAISLVTITFTVAIMISALLVPFVNMGCSVGLPRWISATVVFIVGASLLGLLGWFVVSQITNNMDQLTQRLNESIVSVSHWLKEGPLQMSQTQVDDLAVQIRAQLGVANSNVVNGAFSTLNSAMNVLSGIVLCLFFLLFLLFDDGTVWRWVVSLFPTGARVRANASGRAAWRTLVAYMRSLVLLAVINALTMVVIMMVAGVELVVPLGVLLFLGALIPMVGMIVAGVVMVMVVLVTKSAAMALAMLIALVLTIQLEGNLLNPYILGKAVSIHPLAILATVTGGTLVGGIYGAFVAVPLVAVVNNVAKALRKNHGQISHPTVNDTPEMAHASARSTS